MLFFKGTSGCRKQHDEERVVATIEWNGMEWNGRTSVCKKDSMVVVRAHIVQMRATNDAMIMMALTLIGCHAHQLCVPWTR